MIYVIQCAIDYDWNSVVAVYDNKDEADRMARRLNTCDIPEDIHYYVQAYEIGAINEFTKGLIEASDARSQICPESVPQSRKEDSKK